MEKQRLTDEEVYREYLTLMRTPLDQISPDIFAALVKMVGKCREDEPRINRGVHLADYLNICDEDDTMDSFYGPDYFQEDA